MKQFEQAFERWYHSLKVVKANEGPAKGTIAAALVILEQLKINYILDLKTLTAGGGAPLKGTSGKAVADVLKKFGETRVFTKEGGRTNRGSPSEISSMLNALGAMSLEILTEADRNNVLVTLQSFLVERIRDFHNRQRLSLSYDPTRSTWYTIQALLEKARETGKAGPVAQHLVGAKLEVRFPNLQIQNESYSTADVPTGRSGDFIVGETVFHVTVAPMPGVYQKCLENIQAGFRVYLLVSDFRLTSARQNALDLCGGRVAVESIESFVSQNVEELGAFSQTTTRNELAHLLQVYNRRVMAVEVDKSLMIDIPAAFLK